MENLYSGMITNYYNLIKMELWTIDKVPEWCKTQVEELLKNETSEQDLKEV